MVTPQQLDEMVFPKAVFGGYDMQSVDELLMPLAEDYKTLYKENAVLKSKLRVLVEKLEEYRKQEATMQNAMVAAQQTADRVVQDAERKAAALMNEAEKNAQHTAVMAARSAGDRPGDGAPEQGQGSCQQLYRRHGAGYPASHGASQQAQDDGPDPHPGHGTGRSAVRSSRERPSRQCQR